MKVTLTTPAKVLPAREGGVDYGTERKLLAAYDGKYLIWHPGHSYWAGLYSPRGYARGALRVAPRTFGYIGVPEYKAPEGKSITQMLKDPEVLAWIAEHMGLPDEIVISTRYTVTVEKES